jgi:hypothetical protein
MALLVSSILCGACVDNAFHGLQMGNGNRIRMAPSYCGNKLMKLPSLDGGSWVDLFGLAILARLIAPLFHFPPMNAAEAGTWAATIASFSFYNTNGPKT